MSLLLSLIWMLHFNVTLLTFICFNCIGRRKKSIKSEHFIDSRRRCAIHDPTITNGGTKTNDATKDTKECPIPGQHRHHRKRPHSKTHQNLKPPKGSVTSKNQGKQKNNNNNHQKPSKSRLTSREDLEEPSAIRDPTEKEEKKIVEQTKTFSWNSKNVNRRVNGEYSSSLDDFDKPTPLLEQTATDNHLSQTQVETLSEKRMKPSKTITTTITKESKAQRKMASEKTTATTQTISKNTPKKEAAAIKSKRKSPSKVNPKKSSPLCSTAQKPSKSKKKKKVKEVQRQQQRSSLETAEMTTHETQSLSMETSYATTDAPSSTKSKSKSKEIICKKNADGFSGAR